jgi:lysyl-tRNA synthetase class 2
MSDPTHSSPISAPQDTSTYEQERRAKLQKLRDLGVDPFGARVENIKPLAEVKAAYTGEMGHDSGPTVTVAGRIMLSRSFGKLTFMTLRDDSGDLQIGIDKKRVSERDWQIHELLDLGDQVVVTGKLGSTKKGETTIWAESVTIAAKALHPPPAKWEGLSDVELRYRQRYVDLWANPEVMKLAKIRIRVVDEIRAFLKSRGYLEVETPMMQLMHGGAAARPFKTHHLALDIPLYMRIAPELFLKRLLVGGFRRVFEINRNFRNEGISPRHNPEFTMLEAYEAYGSWETMAEMVESLICHVAQTVFGTMRIKHPSGREINLEGDTTKPMGYRWRRVPQATLVEERTGWHFDKRPLNEMDQHVTRRIYELYAPEAAPLLDKSNRSADEERKLVRLTTFIHHLNQLSPAEQLQEVYEKLIEPTLIDPTFVTEVPSVIIPLARENPQDSFFADVYELAINGIEISPGYTELNDPDRQREHFMHQVGDEAERQQIDEDFLNALKFGMPPAGGMGMGIDRLLLTLTGAESIRDVILFPLMKPVFGD